MLAQGKPGPRHLLTASQKKNEEKGKNNCPEPFGGTRCLATEAPRVRLLGPLVGPELEASPRAASNMGPGPTLASLQKMEP